MDSSYTSLDCLRRLRALQALCHDEGQQLPVDALLVIPGIDGGNNMGSAMIVKYLLLGQSGAKLLDSKLDPDFEDVMLTISGAGVGMYCNHRVSKAVEALISLWRGLTTHVLSAEEMFDADAAEEFKVESFIALVGPHKNFAIAPQLEVGRCSHPGLHSRTASPGGAAVGTDSCALVPPAGSFIQGGRRLRGGALAAGPGLRAGGLRRRRARVLHDVAQGHRHHPGAPQPAAWAG